MFDVKQLKIALVFALLVQSWVLACCTCDSASANESPTEGPPLTVPVQSDDCDCVLCAAQMLTMYAPREAAVEAVANRATMIADGPRRLPRIRLRCQCDFPSGPCIYELAMLRE